ADGYESTKLMHDDASFTSLLDRVLADRGHRTERGRSEITSPWDIVRLDLDGQTDTYVGDELYKAPGFGSGVTLESADYLLRFKPWEQVAKISPREVLIVHGENNELHKLSEAQRLYDTAQEPKTLEVLTGKGHTEWMLDEDPTFVHLTDTLDKFFSSAFGAGSPR
ncbi:MAG: alpha/beta hydrolase, partial [Pseudonocardiaceae bacterium]